MEKDAVNGNMHSIGGCKTGSEHNMHCLVLSSLKTCVNFYFVLEINRKANEVQKPEATSFPLSHFVPISTKQMKSSEDKELLSQTSAIDQTLLSVLRKDFPRQKKDLNIFKAPEVQRLTTASTVCQSIVFPLNH